MLARREQAKNFGQNQQQPPQPVVIQVEDYMAELPPMIDQDKAQSHTYLPLSTQHHIQQVLERMGVAGGGPVLNAGNGASGPLHLTIGG